MNCFQPLLVYIWYCYPFMFCPLCTYIMFMHKLQKFFSTVWQISSSYDWFTIVAGIPGIFILKTYMSKIKALQSVLTFVQLSRILIFANLSPITQSTHSKNIQTWVMCKIWPLKNTLVYVFCMYENVARRYIVHIAVLWNMIHYSNRSSLKVHLGNLITSLMVRHLILSLQHRIFSKLKNSTEQQYFWLMNMSFKSLWYFPNLKFTQGCDYWLPT